MAALNSAGTIVTPEPRRDAPARRFESGSWRFNENRRGTSFGEDDCRSGRPLRSLCSDGGLGGRADLLDYLAAHNIAPADYIGIEAVGELVAVAQKKQHRHAKVIEADFVENPASLFVGAEVVIISGALNTLDTPTFYTTIRRAFDAAAQALVFNFLDSPSLAAASYLTWHAREEVVDFAHSLSREVHILSDYLDGDSTIAIKKKDVHT